MKKNYKTLTYSAVAVVILAILIIPKITKSGRGDKALGKSRTENAVLNLSARIIKTETLDNNVSATGTILANDEVELRSEISGVVESINFREGSNVNKGDLLIKINDEDLRAELDRAKYRLKLLEDREYRQKVLLQKEAISQEDYDVSLNELNVAKSEVDIVQAQINKTEIRAPFSGKIGLKSISQGSFVNNSIVMATLQNIFPVKIDFSIPEKYSLQVSSGDKVNFTVTGSNEKFTGEIYAIEPKIDPVTRTLKLRALYPNTKGRILPGSFADIQLVLKEITGAILIPSQAVIPELKGQKVFVYRSGIASSVPVETGIRNEESVQITKGLSDGDTLITSGILQLRPGVPVKISKFN